MAKVYVVVESAGIGDQEILGVFLDLEKAKSLHGGPDVFIERYELDKPSGGEVLLGPPGWIDPRLRPAPKNG
jgi:hypothetical protein